MMNWPDHFAVIDTETTGVGEDARIVEIAVACFERGEWRHGWSSLCNPGIPIPAEATAVHGITDEMVKWEPPVFTVASEMCKQTFGYPLAAYNESFDRRMLFIATGWDRTNDPWLDPLVWICECQKYEKGKKLGDVAARLGIVPDGNLHRASADAALAGQVLVALRRPSAWADWTRRMGRHPRDFFPSDYDECIRAQEVLRVKQEEEFKQWRDKQPKKEAANG